MFSAVPTRRPSAERDAAAATTGQSYEPAFDGIRGLAVMAIMAYHGGVFLTTGGFYSLDAFFALSGFLITRLLLAEWDGTGVIRLGRFWERRARRLLPALLLVVLAVTCFVKFIAAPGLYPGFRGDAMSTLFYVANWHFIAEGSNYFAQTGATSPLLHTWSLAVEEQFYFVWPVLVLVVLKLRGGLRSLLALSVIGAVASAIVMGFLYSSGSQNRVYYGTDTRAQSLLLGAALAVFFALMAERRVGSEVAQSGSQLRSSDPPVWSGSAQAVGSIVGILGVAATALLWSLVDVNQPLAFRGGFFLAALATCAVMANIVIAPTSWTVSCLRAVPLRYVGRVSYGTYLWHFPIFIWLDYARTGLNGWALFAVRVLCTLLIATISYYLLEEPIRQRRFLRSWSGLVAAPAAMIVVVVAVLATTVTVTAASTFHPPSDHTTGIYAGPPVRVLLLGDSTAYTMGLGLSAYQKDYDVRLHNAGILGCGVTDGAEYQLQGVDRPMVSSCTGSQAVEQWQQIWRSEIAKTAPNVVMILAGRWEVTNRTYQGHWTNILQPAYARYVHHQLVQAVQLAASRGARVMLLTAPCYDTGEQPNGQPWPEDSPRRLAAYNEIVRQVAASSSNTTLVNFNAMACPSGHYQTYIDGVDARYDGVHFTLGGGEVFDRSLLPIAVRIGRGQSTSS